jgi:hypothetical protein
MREQINKKTSISLGIVLTISSIAFASGVLWMKIESFDTRLAKLENKVEDIHNFIRPSLVSLLHNEKQ